MKKGTLLYLAQAGMIAAIYAALTYLAMALNLEMCIRDSSGTQLKAILEQ